MHVRIAGARIQPPCGEKRSSRRRQYLGAELSLSVGVCGLPQAIGSVVTSSLARTGSKPSSARMTPQTYE
jgi:hypothetical protein